MELMAFASLLETIRFLGGKTRSKEESLAYEDFLRYARSLARFNNYAVDTEHERRVGKDFYASRLNSCD